MKKFYYEMVVTDEGGSTEIRFSSLEKAEEWVEHYSRFARVEKRTYSDCIEYKMTYEDSANDWSAEIYEKTFSDLA